MKYICLFFLMPLLAGAQTWSEHIAPIFYNSCTKCHHTGGIAPSSYMTYQEAASNASSIRVKVQQRKMPPWPPDPSYSRFAHERTLTQQEINDIVGWVQNGTPEGDTSLAPPAPVYNGAAEITNPDLVLQIPNYTVNTPAGDLYRCFVLPTGIAANRFITELEALPGNRSIVHHILVFYDTSSVPLQLDAQDPGPGYTSFGGTGSNTSRLIGLWAPGGEAYRLPQGMGLRLPANANVILQIHYPPGIHNASDSSQIRMKLTASMAREVFIDAPLNHFQLDNGPLIIAPNATPTFNAHFNVNTNLSILAVAPHMHLIGRSISSYTVTPSSDTIPIIHIPTWDFHWQGMYSFPRIIKIPAGSTLYSSAYYDNTGNNPNNPNDPPQLVTLGEGTEDEMMLVFFTYTSYQPGDEFIVQDTSFFTAIPENETVGIVHTPQLYDPAPNPSTDYFNARFFLPVKTKGRLTIYDMNGMIIREPIPESELPSGLHSRNIYVGDLREGVYLLQLETPESVRSKKIIRR